MYCRLPRPLRLFSAFAAAFCAAAGLQAQTTVATNPVGFVQTSCLTNSDTILSIPFFRPPEYVSTVQSVSGNVITLTGTTLTANQFVYVQGSQPKTYFALIGSNNGVTHPRDGAMYSITANGTNSLTLSLNGDSLGTVPAGAQVQVIPYWTPNAIFPASMSGTSFTPSPNFANLKTQILIPDYLDSGINLATSGTYFFLNGAWRSAGDSITVDHGDDILVTDGYIIVRNDNGAPTLPVTFLGAVHVGKQLTPLNTSTNTNGQDNAVGLLRPIDVPLNSLGLSPGAGNFTASPNFAAIQDELLLYDNSVSGINKSSSKAYFYYNGAWRLEGDDVTVDHGTDVVSAGTGVTIRKAKVTTAATQLWTNSPNY